MHSSVQENLATVKQKLRDYEIRYHRPINSVSLLAVTKHQPIEKITAAIEANQFEFGENYLQEALPKIEYFADKNIIWHFIGPIQSNKTKKIAECFSWVHTVSDSKIAQRLNDQRPADLPELNICIQVNVSEEDTKSGINLSEIENLAKFCITLPRLKLRGLMTIPAPTDNLASARAELHKLQIAYGSLIKKGFPLDTLSMGMTDDMEAAVAEKSTIVRIGTAIFGARI